MNRSTTIAIPVGMMKPIRSPGEVSEILVSISARFQPVRYSWRVVLLIGWPP
jgi:hypothetical protein